ncbi:MAG: MBL fold metallo-hydrolase [Desulfofustis sp. PB-SRB1]|jgi:7,8-dihydropterin-6-yl-methyl-4-(beta-D-ribofuranosyl)aminobenzene 5'-phosphate synthase|nr:MBL fold metallo-hydrolase [Desulfofustis sp. PB-SRB1]MBM1002640.1 MBL fold metallo-hydrolase [Desulfofustis sp. PB-SRB1]HBH29297.1 MBL fold metallo-hydrolase [Desulfofustis sp.]HBH31999.1 MBL fold metallo-hydrolase [Desulfofustis sp.]
MTTHITTLVENRTGEHKALKAEHGLSFFIQHNGMYLIFDTGQSDAFADNARLLNLDLTKVDTVILSHGHYDHGGGLRYLTDLTTSFTLHTGTGFFRQKYAVSGQAAAYLGVNFKTDFLRSHAIPHEELRAPHREIAPGVHLFSQFPRVHEDETINPRFMIFEDGDFKPDPFADEICLALDSSNGLIVLLGCAHPGMKNMLDHIRHTMKQHIYAILGGTHLVEAADNGMESSFAYLRNNTIEVIAVSHCTGESALNRLAAENSNYAMNCTGSSLFVA